jgi:hypothetical protein
VRVRAESGRGGMGGFGGVDRGGESSQAMMCPVVRRNRPGPMVVGGVPLENFPDKNLRGGGLRRWLAGSRILTLRLSVNLLSLFPTCPPASPASQPAGRPEAQSVWPSTACLPYRRKVSA